MTVALAFYKGKGNLLDRVIRLVTGSQYSHVEYIQSVDDIDPEGRHECWSSSPRDGGVRCKRIGLKSSHWDIVPVNFYDENADEIFYQFQHCKYDYWGIILNHIFAFHGDSFKKWFCSEFVGFVLALPNPQIYSPGTLKELAEHLNEVSDNGYGKALDLGDGIGLKNV